MLRTLAAFLVLSVAACSAQAAPSVPTSSPTVGPTSSPMPTDPPASESQAPEPPSPSVAPEAPTWEGHPAEGLALVRFLDENDPNTQVFIVEADGAFRQVTGLSDMLGATFPVWSPDGSRLAFTGPKRGETTFAGMLAVVNADGSDERQIAEGQIPRWSPDGTMIVFQEVDDVTGEDLSFYLVNPDTGEITDLGIGYDARWLDEGRLLYTGNAYAADGEATSALYVMTLATGDVAHVADWTTAHPSPDRSMLLSVTEAVVSLTDADGTMIREAVAEGADPVWAPDGTRFAVAYTHDNDANPVWAIVDLEGTVLRTDIVGSRPTWSPDGTRLALEVYRPDVPVVQVVDVATGDVVWENTGQQPAWRP